MVMLTWRTLHLSRLAMLSTFAFASSTSWLSQRRPRTIDAIKVARVSDRIGRACCGGRGRQEYLAAPRCRCFVPWDMKVSNVDAPNVVGDEAPVVNRLRWLEMVPNRSRDQGLDVGCREPAYRSGALPLALEQGGRQIVPILDTPFADVTRCHAIAAVIEHASSQ